MKLKSSKVTLNGGRLEHLKYVKTQAFSNCVDKFHYNF